MKTTIVAIALLASGLASAHTSAPSVPSFNAKDHSCAQLKSLVARHGTINVKFTPFGARHYHSQPNQCWSQFIPVGTHLRAAGGESCYLRWACEYDNSRNR